MNFDILEDYTKYIGMILSMISIIMLVYLFLNPAMGYFIHIDEQFTLTLFSIPFNDAWKMIVNDVHPPLYYLILFGFGRLFQMLNVTIDPLYLSKLVSLVPAVLLIIISCTKIRREYGWLACGVFLFGITTMANAGVIYITSRMYSWSVLFMIIAFICYGEVLKSSTAKSWILFTLSVILCAYTHYILLFPLFIMYVTYFIYIKLNDKLDKKTEYKKTIASIVASIILYIPWIPSFINQIATINRTYVHTAKLSGDAVFNYLTCFVLPDSKQLLDFAFWKFLVVLLAVILLLMFIMEIRNYKDYEAFHIFSGANVYLFTIILASFFVTFIYKGITVRYFVAVMAVLWLAIAILLSRVKNYKLLFVALILIIGLGAHGIVSTVNDMNYHNQLALEQQSVTGQINNPDNVVIYNGTYSTYHLLLNNTKEYSLKEEAKVINPTYTYEEDLDLIMEDNPDKNVYLVTGLANINNKDENITEDITAKKLCRQGRIWIMKLNQVNTDKEDNETATDESK